MISLYELRRTERGQTMAVSFKGAHVPKDIMSMGVHWYVA
jgi:hypothetical protein